jgi:hypothetical protein
MGKFLVLAAATVALNAFAPLAHAQDYTVNGHAASKAEAQFLASYSAPLATGRSTGMASRAWPMSIRSSPWRRLPAPSAGMSLT